MHHRTTGFSLIELLIVVVILGILATIAYPSYSQWVTETRRSDAQSALVELAARQERYFSQCNSYTSTLTGSATPTDCTNANRSGGGLRYPGSVALSPDGHYVLSISAATTACPIASCYEAIADPAATGASQRQKSDGKLRILSSGARSWDRNNDDTFAATENSWKK